MFFKIVIFVIVMNLIYELIEIVFPSKNMKLTIKSFSLIVMLYALCDYLIALI